MEVNLTSVETTLRDIMQTKVGQSLKSAGADKVVFNILEDQETGDLYIEDNKTISDVSEAYKAGKEIEWQYLGSPTSFVTWSIDEFGGVIECDVFNVYPLMSQQTPGELECFDFECIIVKATGVTYNGMSVTGTPF